MRWITIACATVLCTHTAMAAPVFDDQRGQARDAFRDFAGVDLLAPETTGVVNDTAATLVRLAAPNTRGALLTQPYEPLSASAWKKVYLAYTAAAGNDIALAVHDADGAFIGNVPLVPTAQAGFKAEADLSGFALATYPALRFAITLDGVGAPFAPALDDLLVTWSPLARVDLGAVAGNGRVCAGDTFTIDVPVAVSFVRAEGLGVKVDKPVASGNTHPIGELEVVSVSHAQSATSPGRVATTTRSFDALNVSAGEVYWSFNGPVAAGTSLVLSVTYRVPGGIDDGTRFTTRARADATNAALTASGDVVLTTEATPAANITVGYTTAYSTADTIYANQGETITAHVRVDNAHGTPCGQALHDLVIVDQLDGFVGGTTPAYLPPPSAISHGGVYVAANDSATFFGRSVTGPAVVWTHTLLSPATSIERTYRLTLESNANLADGATPSRRAYVTSAFDGTSANHQRGITVGLPDQPNGTFAIGQKYLGQVEVNAQRDDLGGLVIPSGAAFTYVLYGDNRGLSALDDVYLYLPIPAGLDYLDVSAPAHADVFFNDAPLGADAPDVVAGVLGASWVADPSELAGPVRWVAARATLASSYFGNTAPTRVTVEVDVAEAIVGGGCEPASYEAKALFSVTAYTPVGDTTPVPNGGFVSDNELARTAPAQPIIRDFGVARDLGQRVGAGPITYTMHVANDGSSIDSIDLGRDAVLTIDLPYVELLDGPGYLPVVSVDPRDGVVDTTQLADGKLFVRWATLPARSSRDVVVVLRWPAGSVDGASAELRASLTVEDDVCAPRFASAAATTTLLVRPALAVDKVVDLDAATPGSRVTYSITATNDGDGAATNTLVFDRLPLGMTFERAFGADLGGVVYVSNAQPPTLPATYTNLAQLDRALVDTYFVPAIQQTDGSWTSPLPNTTWVAIDLDDHGLTPPRLPSGRSAGVQIVATVDALPAQSVINNRAAVDADDVFAAVSRAARTVVSGAPTARITRSMPAVVASDEVFSYTITIANTGTVTASSVVLSELLPPGVTYVGSTFAWNETSSGPTITPTLVGDTLTWDLGANVGSLQGGTVTVTVRADDDLAHGDTLPFAATATIKNPSNPAGVTVGASSVVRISTADLVAAVSLDRQDPIAGDRLTATLVVTNQGEHVADDTGFTVRVPAALGYVPGSVQVSGYLLGEPTVVPVIVGTQTIGYDLVWTDLTRTGQPTGRIPGSSGPIAITLQLDVAPGTAPATDLPVTLTVATSTGQGGATDNDTASVTATTPEANPNVTLIAPSAVKPGDTAAVTVRYGNDTRQPAGPSTIVVTVPSDGAPNTFVRATASHGETLYYYMGTPGATLTLPADPIANGWTTTPSAAVTHVAITANGIPGNTTHDVVLQTRFVSPSGDLVSGGTHHDTRAVITSASDGDGSDNTAHATIDVPGLNLTAALTAAPNGANPGVVAGGAVTHTATVTNTGLAASFGTYLVIDRGALVPNSTLPAYAAVSAVGPTGATLTQSIPLTVVGDRILIGTNGGASDPLDYRNVGLRPGASLSLVFTGTVPSATASGTNLVATFTVGSDYAYDHNPNADPELATDNVATASVTAYRPDLVVAMHASDEAGNNAAVGRGDRVIWTVSYDNVGDIAADDATLTSSVAGGTAFVIGSITDVPAGFHVEYLGPGGWGYVPTGAAGTIDATVRAVRMIGSDLATPLNPSYVASASALAAGATGNSQFLNGRVGATTADGDTWISELVTHDDLAQWTRVTFADRQGDDPLYVTVLDGNGLPVPGYSDVAVDGSGAIDISGIDAATHGSLQFKVSFGGQSPVCDLAAGRGVEIDSGGYTRPVEKDFDPYGPRLFLGDQVKVGGGPSDNPRSTYYQDGGQWTWTGTTSAFPQYASACTSSHCFSVGENGYWNGTLENSTRGLTITLYVGTGYVGAPEMPWLQVPYSMPLDYDWLSPTATTYTTRYSDNAGGIAAASLVPSPDLDPGAGIMREPLPYAIRFDGDLTMDALPLPNPAARYDFDGQGYTTPDVVFGRELGGDAIIWTRDAGAWSANPIERPLDATGDATVRTAPDAAQACVSFPTTSGPVAWLATPSAVTSIGAYACDAALGGGQFVLAGGALFDVEDGVVYPLADSAGYTMIERAGGSGATADWIVGRSGGEVAVWMRDGASYTRHVVASGVTTVHGFDTQGVVYVDDPQFRAIVVAADGSTTAVAMTPAGWSPITSVRQVRDGVFAGRSTGTSDVLGVAIVSYDVATSSLSSFVDAGTHVSTYTIVRTTAGAWAGGRVGVGDNASVPTIWGPTGEGPGGWSPIALPKLPGTETTEYTVIGMNHGDPTVAIGEAGPNLVSWTKGPMGWTVHAIAEGVSIVAAQGAHYSYSYEPVQNVVMTNNGFFYYDPTSITGVRRLGANNGESGPQSNSNGIFSPQAGRPIFVANGRLDGGPTGPVVWTYEGDTLVGERLPGLEGYFNNVHPTRPLITGSAIDEDGVWRAAVWTRESGTWELELFGNEYDYGVFFTGDGTVFGSVSGVDGAYYAFFQKRGGSWQTFPLYGASVNWSSQNLIAQDNMVMGNFWDGISNKTKLWRTPSPNEAAPRVIDLVDGGGNPGGYLENRFYLGDGILLGRRTGSDGSWNTYWRVGADGTVTQLDADATHSSTSYWHDPSYFTNSPGQKARSVSKSPDYGAHVWVPNATGGTLAATYPPGYAPYKSNIVINAFADIHSYGSWGQGRLYGCWMASDASFGGFAVGYRTGTSPTYSFRTEVLADTCQATLSGSTTAATNDPDSDTSNDVAEAAIAFEHAELSATLHASHAVAPVGTTIHYTATITNHGPAPAAGVSAALTDPDGVVHTTPIGAIASGASHTFGVDYDIAEGADGIVINALLAATATTADCDPDDDVASAATVVSNLPNAWVALEGPTTAIVGMPYALKVRFGNDSAVPTDAGTIALELPPGLSFVNAGDATLVVPALGAGQSDSTTVMVVASPSLIGQAATSSAHIVVTGDILGGDDDAFTTTSFSDAGGALGVAIYADHASIGSGDRVGFAVLFDNRGLADAADTRLVVSLPPGTYLAGSSTGTYNPTAHTLTWALGDLPAGHDGGVGLALGGVGTSLTPVATLTAAAAPTATASTTVAVTSGVHVSASVDHLNLGGGASAGQLEWTVVVHNDGAATTVALSDLAPPGTTYVPGSISGPGADDGTPPFMSWSFPIGSGETRTLHFATSAPTSDTTNLTAGANVTPVNVRSEALPTLLTTTEAEWILVGDELAVTISYVNFGGPLTGAVLHQSLGGTLLVADPGTATVSGSNLSWNLGALAAGASGTVTFTVTATNAGPFTVERANLTSSGLPQLGNDVFGVAVEPCDDDPCETSSAMPNEGCVAEPVADGTIIDTLSCGTGACAATANVVCTGGVASGTCTPGQPGDETCNGMDDDCDDAIDEDLTRPSTCGVGACAGNTGTETCVGGDWTNNTCDPDLGAGVESCNGEDDDCDGTIDDGLTRPTTCGQGECADNTGVETCSAGAWGGDTCNPLAGAVGETCNGDDDDCDGDVDEDLTRVTTCGQGECTGNTGLETCSAGAWGGNTCNPFAGAAAETCNGDDDDCDGAVDEDLTRPTTCGVGACTGNVGSETCSAGTWGNDTCSPLAGAVGETCNDVDDDCDGDVDEALTRQTTCGQGLCAGNTGNETCVAGDWGGDTCDPLAGSQAESCNNADDDCDGDIDEELTRQTTCGEGACAGNSGSETCNLGAWSGDSCDPLLGATIETCNDQDDDCDGDVDEDLTGEDVACTMVGGCAGVTTQVCSGGEMVAGECRLEAPIADSCNGLDDDCDAATDEDFAPETISCGVDACAAGEGSTTCVDGVVVDSCDELWSDIPDTICGEGATGLNVAYIIVTNAAGDAIGSVRCFQDLSAPNTPVACDTEADATTLKVYTELLCQGVEP